MITHQPYHFTLNGKKIQITDESPNLTLLQYLRQNGHIGSKEGCAEGDCGACTVAILERNAKGEASYRAVNSCIMLLPMLAGREVITSEGLACHETLHPVQQAMVANHGSQCGYCTPGFVMSLFEAYYRKDLKQQWQINDQLCGNLCRCTGYRPIRDAAVEVLTGRFKNGVTDPFAERLECVKNESQLAPGQYAPNSKQFFLRPSSLKELLQMIHEFPDARLIAGGTELGVDIAKNFKYHPYLISTEAVGELKTITSTKQEWHIGAAATLTQIEETLQGEIPSIQKMLTVFASRQIRNRATLGGNLVNASPIGDMAPVLLTLDARLIVASMDGEREIPIDQFFLAYRKTALEPREILKSIIIPRQLPGRANSFKVSKRMELDISTVAAAFRVELDDAAQVKTARLAYGGVAATPVRAKKTEQFLLNKAWNRETLTEAMAIIKDEFTPITDARGTADYRRELIPSLLEKFFDEEEFPINYNAITPIPAPAIRPIPHESGHKHVAGTAIYVDDAAEPAGMLEVWPVCSPYAHARIIKRDAHLAKQMPDIVAVLMAEDVPGENDVGAVRHDEILLADKETLYHGHLVALVVGKTQEACRAAAAKVQVEYEPLEPVIDLKKAIAQNMFHTDPHVMERGDAKKVLNNSPNTLVGDFHFGGQEHFYLETHAAWAEPGEDGEMFVSSSTQHPSEIQIVVARVLGVSRHKVVCQSPRMGGGFGGKETQGNTPAALAAIAARKTGKRVRVRLNREQDMILSGKRHPFYAQFKIGFDNEGKLLALQADLFADGGWALDLSQPVADRALFHLDNSYYLPNVRATSRVVKTHIASNTAFRGFGGPQGMLVIEEIMDRIARQLGLPPETVRERNLYHGTGETNTTHYGQVIEDNRLQKIWHELIRSSDFHQRRKQLKQRNAENARFKRGIAITPVKFGISFTLTHMNQAGAFVVIYADGSVQLNHGGTEMGQGLHTKMIAVAVKELGVKVEQIRVMNTSTDKVPNTSPTAASSGSDLNGQAVKNACVILRERLTPVAMKLLEEEFQQKSSGIIFEDGEVYDKKFPHNKISFIALTQRAYVERISLSTTGFFATPGIYMDWSKGKGNPFLYFACGAAVTEVEIDSYTGMNRILRVDILHDVGSSLNEAVDRGQIEGAFVQGMGWLTCEELKWDDKGKLLTKCASTYAIPAISNAPIEFNVKLLPDAAQHNTIHGSKAVGEPPLMLAISVREALRDAIAAFSESGEQIPLPSPATNEAIYLTLKNRQTSKSNKSNKEKKSLKVSA
ncbi:MAG: xanthine dehydrogenase molybdopterin binding subunit [Verrucomicrobiae bacterium]|nr:xanthine dehydrogenase molybdopterin binding subunit [Verrucomicrobiae bacterium]